jgi:hypothetical protein
VKLAHFYHVYADGDWQSPVTEHLHALTVSGLLERLNDFFVGIVGTPENRQLVREALPAMVIAEADQGWEQVTLQELHKYSHKHKAQVLYAHTKGAYQVDELRSAWRVSMTHDTVTRWRECVQELEMVQVAGPFWMKSSSSEHNEHGHFFGGNFWWAQSEYLAALPALKNDNRFQAEGWIGLGSPSVKVMREGLATWGNFWQKP